MTVSSSREPGNCFATHQLFKALSVCGLGGLLEDSRDEQGVLGEPLHGHHQEVFQLQPVALCM